MELSSHLDTVACCCICHAVIWSPNSSLLSSSAATHVLTSSCIIKRLLKRTGEQTFVKSTTHISKQAHTSPRTDSLLHFPENALDVNTRSINLSKSWTFIEVQQSNCVIIRKLYFNIRVAQESTGISALELESS